MGSTPESSDAAAEAGLPAVVRTAPPVAPDAPVAPQTPSVLDRVRAVLTRTTVRQVLGGAMVVVWAAWLGAVWVTQPRLVSQDVLADDLAQGRVSGYRVVTVDEDRTDTLSGPYRLDVWPASDDDDGLVDGRYDSVAYWVDTPVAAMRVLEAEGQPTDGMVTSFTATGVPEANASVFFRGLPAERAYNAGAWLLLLSTVVVILGPRPRRGTRWFWFWVIGGPLSVGVPVFAVLELLRPRYEPPGTVHPPGVAGRWKGLLGFAIGAVATLAGSWLLITLSGLSPIWFVRG
jgi:hypothetical protein